MSGNAQLIELDPKDIIIEKLQRDLADKAKIILSLSALEVQNKELRDRIQNLQGLQSQLDALIIDNANKAKLILTLKSAEINNVELRRKVNELQLIIDDSGIIDVPTSDKQIEFNMIINQVYPKLRYMKNLFKYMDENCLNKEYMNALMCSADFVKCQMDKAKNFARNNVKKCEIPKPPCPPPCPCRRKCCCKEEVVVRPPVVKQPCKCRKGF